MSIVLNGSELNVSQLSRIARQGESVELDSGAVELMVRSRALVFKLADKGIPIYGFTVGVGWNKDKHVFDKYFEEYNRNLIYAHCAGVGPYLSAEDVRAILAVRLNVLLCARTGIQLAVAEMYRDFLNKGIHPMIPARGSVGEGDITTLSHIGLAMIGEGEVLYKGRQVPALEALKAEGLKPVILGPKDGLAIVSSNAQSAAMGTLLIADTLKLVAVANAVYALSLEGFNGNVTPLDPAVNSARGIASQSACAEAVRSLLKGSALENKGITKALQDPLSFRCAIAIHGTVLDALEYTWKLMKIQLNATEDNPCILLEEEQMLSCCNFEITNWVLGFEMLGQALAHVSRSACHRTIKLSDPSFTGLSRFLSPNEGTVQAYQTIQKTFTSLDGEIRHLMNPAHMDYLSVAGEIEDHATNAPFVIEKTRKILDNLYYILGMEAMHAAQAVDLRGDIRLGEGSKILYEKIRSVIPFLDVDRPLSPDIQQAYALLQSDELYQSLQGITPVLQAFEKA